jgi:hypothetical protein
VKNEEERTVWPSWGITELDCNEGSQEKGGTRCPASLLNSDVESLPSLHQTDRGYEKCYLSKSIFFTLVIVFPSAVLASSR